MPASPARHASAARRDWWWIFDPRCSLRARAALSIGGGLVAITLLLSWLTGVLYRRSLEAHLAGAFETLAFQVGDKLDRAVYERYRTLQLAASLATIRDVAASATDRRRVLEVIQETEPEFAWLGFADPAGRVIASTGRVLEDTVQETKPWFREGRERPFVGALQETAPLTRAERPPGAPDSPTRSLELAVPVTGSNGQFAGVLAAQIRWDWSREVQQSVVPEAAGRDAIGVTIYGPGRDVLLDSGASGWTHPPDAPSVGEGRRFRGAIVEPVGPARYLTGYSRSRGFREYRGIGWLVVVRQPIDRAFASVAPLRRSIALWGCVLAVTAAVAGWILAGRHARKLRSIRAAAERIHEGDILTVLPRPKDESEIAGMCGALGDLVEDLRARQEKLLAENARLAAQVRENEAAKG